MIVVGAEHRPSDTTQALLEEMRQWVDRLCTVADEIEARARETARGGNGGGRNGSVDKGGEGTPR